MTTLQRTLLIFTIGLFSCDTNQTKTTDQKIYAQSDTVKKINKPPSIDTSRDTRTFIDTFRRFEVDDYPVTPNMLTCNDNSSACNIKYKDIISVDKVWFTNDTLKQSLVFEMYTDGFRVAIFHFRNNSIPTELIKKMYLSTADGELASDKQKLENFKGFIPLARKINSSYFTSYKGFKLGDSKEKVIKVYGKPDAIKSKNGFEEYEWDFIGDILYDGKEKLKRNRLAKDNYGHQSTMYFKNNKLVGLLLYNDIP
jgi:hypothetical protein